MEDLEKLGKALLAGPKGDALRSIADSDAAKALGQKLDAAAVERAARSADGEQLKALLKSILSTEEGRALAEQLSRLGE